mmetsp:Transcript_22214/g.56022  ORF Transcript_22214/g.56022 Transcript_22214/m.56022 type:complete len:221 (-) Transcript_22214:218-880(-)|eukprot:CAMPEP_0178995088 /NCGR_PEP_ID=MMETSP0795-20121207/7647_1 /TAXON_ID=88552 /ORGANISM="Amoebophrya sp., Strain Ameob2" /LENGTH=220 /DNA_ID=CAMNT_0020687385 /DNA_START=172 /DNA_END=834 /DNA_ORIENTATION=-
MSGDPALMMLAAANGVTTFGAQFGQGTQGLISASNFEEMLTARKQATAAIGRALNAARIAERSGNLAVNIANRAVQSARAMATLEDQGVKNPYGANEKPIMEVGPSPFLTYSKSAGFASGAYYRVAGGAALVSAVEEVVAVGTAVATERAVSWVADSKSGAFSCRVDDEENEELHDRCCASSNQTQKRILVARQECDGGDEETNEGRIMASVSVTSQNFI